MIHFSRTIFPTVILILFLSVESSNGYSDIDVILFIITVFKTCQDGQEKSQYEILKDWHDTNLKRRLNE